ncbi:MAG: EF-P lysine aminoacylase EpmA [Planctomycetaceae bacterium]
MSGGTDWRPSTSLENLKARARLLAEIRQFFDARGFWEVDTPLLSHERAIDPHIEPFAARALAEHCQSEPPALFLQTSPEFAMKRLLAAGARAIYQLGHVFRADERGALHNPEYTMLEWYRVGTTHVDQMQTVEELVVAVGNTLCASGAILSAGVAPPFGRTSYQQAFERHAGIDGLRAETAALKEFAITRRLAAPASLADDDRDGWLNWLLAELVEPQLGREGPEFVFDYPASQAALARVRMGDPPVAERFELYWQGIEICNGYHELTDAAELQRRVDAESMRRMREGRPPLAYPTRLLAAMKSGLPGCSGVALGVDRLLMLLIGATKIDQVLSFASERA